MRPRAGHSRSSCSEVTLSMWPPASSATRWKGAGADAEASATGAATSGVRGIGEAVVPAIGVAGEFTGDGVPERETNEPERRATTNPAASRPPISATANRSLNENGVAMGACPSLQLDLLAADHVAAERCDQNLADEPDSRHEVTLGRHRRRPGCLFREHDKSSDGPCRRADRQRAPHPVRLPERAICRLVVP